MTRPRSLALHAAGFLAAALALPGCTHQRIEFGDEFVGRSQPMELSRPTAIRITRGQQVVSFRIEPYALHGGPPRPARVSLHNSEPVIEVEEGIVFAAGMRPVVKSERVVAAASGTDFVFAATGERWAVIVTASPRQDQPAVSVRTNDGQSAGLRPGELAKLENGKLVVRKHPVPPGDGQNSAKVRDALRAEGL